MAITLPHTFHDGVTETASGVQVMDNLNVLKAAVEALEGIISGASTSVSAGTSRSVGSTYTPNAEGVAAGHATEVLLEIAWNSNALGGNFFRTALSFIVPAGQTWKITEPASGVAALSLSGGGGTQIGPGGTSVKEMFSSYKKLPFG